MPSEDVLPGCPRRSRGYDTPPDSKTSGFDPIEVHNFLGSHHLFNPLLDLVANVSLKPETHEDMLSPLRDVCDSEQVSLVV